MRFQVFGDALICGGVIGWSGSSSENASAFRPSGGGEVLKATFYWFGGNRLVNVEDLSLLEYASYSKGCRKTLVALRDVFDREARDLFGARVDPRISTPRTNLGMISLSICVPSRRPGTPEIRAHLYRCWQFL